MSSHIKSTSDCKAFISTKISSDKILQDECLDHDIVSWAPSKWSRTEKRKIKSDDEVEWILESNFPEFTWIKKDQTSLVGCTMRGFLHKDGDCFVSIITDKNCELVAWTFQID